MIVNEVLDKIYALKHKAMKERMKSIDVVVYIGEELYRRMENELRDSVSSDVYSFVESGGKEIANCRIYLVLGDHGIRACEV